MPRRDFFKLGLLISAGAHFSFLVFFPLWKMAPPPKPEVIEVALIEVQPREIEPEKSPPAPPKPPPPPPAEPKIEKRETPELSPVEVAVKPSQNIPVLTPQARAESALRVPFPTVPFEPVIVPKTKKIPSQEEKWVKKSLQESTAQTRLLPKISSPIQGETPSFVPFIGEGEGETLTPAAEGPEGITFRGLGTRKPERAPQPSFPEEMELRGVEGQGEVKIYVSSKGQVLDVDIVRTSGWHAFDKEIRSTLLKWRFTPIDESGTKTYEGNFRFRFGK